MRLEGKRVVFVGALESLPRRLAKKESERLGAAVHRGITRRTDIVVFGRHATKRLSRERIELLVTTADRVGADTVSESMFQELVCSRSPEIKRGSFTSEQFLKQTSLDENSLRFLCLFDVLQPVSDTFEFRDIVAGKQFASLISEGQSWFEIVDVALTRKELAGQDWRSRERLKVSSWGTVLVDTGNELIDPCGQLHLEFAEQDTLTADDLFELAQEAEDDADWAQAEKFYKRCLELDPKDAVTAFNLANLLQQQDNVSEAKHYFVIANQLDPGFVEAWYNLALINQEDGLIEEARNCLHSAIDADPEYADPYYNLGLLEYNLHNFEKAGQHWQQYIELDSESNWSQKAKQGIILCSRMLAQ